MPADMHVGLLRGINVGGKGRLPMTALVEIFLEAGCADVRTYIQSGNVIFRAPAALVPSIGKLITEKIGARFGFHPVVITRTARQLAKVIRENPFLAAGAPENQLHVAFLSQRPGPLRVKSLDPDRSPPDRFQVLGQEIYFQFSNGVAATKLTGAYFDSRLGVPGTWRNWNTVRKLAELMQA